MARKPFVRGEIVRATNALLKELGSKEAKYWSDDLRVMEDETENMVWVTNGRPAGLTKIRRPYRCFLRV